MLRKDEALDSSKPGATGQDRSARSGPTNGPLPVVHRTLAEVTRPGTVSRDDFVVLTDITAYGSLLRAPRCVLMRGKALLRPGLSVPGSRDGARSAFDGVSCTTGRPITPRSRRPPAIAAFRAALADRSVGGRRRRAHRRRSRIRCIPDESSSPTSAPSG